MKTIKFRVWDMVAKRMYFDAQNAYDMSTCNIQDEIKYGDTYLMDGYVDFDSFGDVIKSENCVLMQFIGAYDENNKEIYEGDIVSIGGSNFLVIYNDNLACFSLRDVFGCGVNWNLCKIVGNYYENSLLYTDEEYD